MWNRQRERIVISHLQWIADDLEVSISGLTVSQRIESNAFVWIAEALDRVNDAMLSYDTKMVNSFNFIEGNILSAADRMQAALHEMSASGQDLSISNDCRTLIQKSFLGLGHIRTSNSWA